MLRVTKKRSAKAIKPTENKPEEEENVTATKLAKQDKETSETSKDQATKERDLVATNLEKLIYSGLVSEDEDEGVNDSEPEDASQDEEPCVWSDPDDDDGLGKKEFERVMGPKPDWAKPKAANDPSMNAFNTDLLAPKSQFLPTTTLDIVKCVDLNNEDRSRLRLEVCEFHPHARMAMTGSKDCRLNLFQVDGKKNAKIHSLFMKSFPITCAHFLTGGHEVLMTSYQPHMYAYDLQSGKVQKTSFVKGIRETKLGNFKVSPNGKHLVFLSSRLESGKMYVVDQKNKELIKTLEMSGSVEDICFYNNGDSMMSYGGDGEICMWDMNSLSCTSTFNYEAGTSGMSIDCTNDGKKFACGTTTGFVDMFDATDLTRAPKTFKNILTPITTLKFNNSGEILGMASDGDKTAIKLAHTSHESVFSNFPLINKRFMGEIKSIDFSPNDGYMLVGNFGGKALLYRLNHYSSY